MYEQQRQRIPTAEAAVIEYHRQAQQKINVAFPELLMSICVALCVRVAPNKPQKRRLWRAHKNPSPSISGSSMISFNTMTTTQLAALWVYPIKHASMTCYSILATRNTHTHTCASNTTRCTALCLLAACLSITNTHTLRTHGLWAGYLCSPQ